MSQPCVALSNHLDQSSDGKSKYKSYTALSCAADGLVVDVFNDCYRVLYSSDPARQNFSLKTTDIQRHRRVISKWSPPKHGSDLGIHGFDVPLALSAYLKRYISFPEMANERSLEASAAKKLLNVNKDGWQFDEYVLMHSNLERLITKMRYHIGCMFSEHFNVADWYAKTGHGPNSTTDVAFSNAYLHVKDLAFVGTKPALQQMIHYLHWDHVARDLMIRENDEVRGAVNGVDVDLSPFVCDVANVSLVPKSVEELRTMRPEGTLNSWFAQMIAKYLTAILKQYCNIDLRNQPTVHRSLAKLGSLYEDLSIGTIDWSEASDRIWTSLVSVLFSEGHAPQLFSFMSNVCRVGKSRLKFVVSAEEWDEIYPLLLSECEVIEAHSYKSKEGRFTRIECIFQCSMFANMGNPITFPLQTLVFWVFLTSCGEIYCEDNPEVTYDELQWPSCFGDDGIIDSRIFSVIQHYAPMLGWKLNVSKSFVEGGFRESCGGDYYYGRYVRPFSPKRPPLDPTYTESRNKKVFQTWSYVLINNMASLLKRCGYDATPLEDRMAEYHRDLELGKVCIIPPTYSEGSGYRVTGFRYNPRLDNSFVGPILKGTQNKDVVLPEREEWHNPYWNIVKQCWTFKSLCNKADVYTLDEFYHAHYLNKWLKSQKDSCDTVYKKTDIFDSHKGLELLDSNGQLRVKEFKPHKTTNEQPVWLITELSDN